MGVVDESVLDAALEEIENEQPNEEPREDNEQLNDADATDEPDETDSEADDEDDEESDEDGSGEASDESEDNDTDSKPAETPQLTNEQLIAELEKRGLKVVDNKVQQQQPQQPQQPAAWERKPKELDDDVWDRMEPENKFIYHQLPTIAVQDKNGKVYHVKTPQQLPDDFEPANDKERTRFNTEMQTQNLRAERMMQEINSRRHEHEAQAQQQAEDQEIMDGINKLMEDGIIPEIKAKPNTPEFKNDTGAIIGEAILEYRNQLRAQGENVSMYMAGKLFRAEHPEFYEKVGATKKPARTADAERKKASKNIAGKTNRGTKSASKFINTEPAPRFAPGTTASDIAALYADELDD